MTLSMNIYNTMIVINFETNDSDNNFILLQRRFDASCIIFKLRIKYSRFSLIIMVRVFVSKQLRKHAKLPNAHGKNYQSLHIFNYLHTQTRNKHNIYIN